MIELLKKFENKQPEVVFEWKDPETEAEGWVVINSLRGGAAGGGTRMRKGLDKHEVTSLAKTMEIKFSCSGPAIGGAKSGINFDPEDPRKLDVLRRWYKAVIPLLKAYYGTGGDLNVDEVKDVIPITEKYGLLHPQEGVLTGHFQPGEEEKNKKIIQLRTGVSKIVEDAEFTIDDRKEYVVADLITGYGVAEAALHYYDIFEKGYAGKKAIIQGWGNVSSAAAYYLAKKGVKIIGIIDRKNGLINKDGFSLEEITKFFIEKDYNRLTGNDLLSFEETDSKIWDLGADIFIPGAASRLITRDQLDRMHKAGTKVISCGANVPFADREIFYGPTSAHADEKFIVIPDFIANCGMARAFAYLMQKDAAITDRGIFYDVSSTINNAIEEVHAENKTGEKFMETALGIALKKIL